METVLIDNEWLTATLPDGFATMEHSELEKFMGFRYDQMLGVHDQGRHMLLCVTWKDSNKVITSLVSEKTFAKQINKAFTKRQRANNYKCEGFLSRDIRGASGAAQGLDFSHTIKGVPHQGEALVFKRGIRCYTLVYYTYAEVAEQNRAVYNKILESLEVR